MRVGRVLAILSTCVVAVALAFAQLTLPAPARPTCCCPDPALCKCADHDPGPAGTKSLRSCRSGPEAAGPQQLAGFVAPVAPALGVVVILAAPPVHRVVAPHPAPVLDDRAAPS